MEENRNIEPVETDEKEPTQEPKRPLAHKRLWAIAVLLCIAAIGAGTYLTFSAYRAGDFLKAVAATSTSQALFTSDLLNEYTSTTTTPAAKSIIVDSSGDTCSFTFRIYNCLLDNKNVFNDKDVNATLVVTAEGAGAGNEWSVSDGKTQDLEFPGYQAVVKTFTVTFKQAYLDKAKFTIMATVDAKTSPGTNLAMLAATIVPNRRADVTNASVQYDWVDKGGNVGDYDAYNFRVTVTGKATNVKLTWGDGVELDPFFSVNHNNATVDKVNRTVTFNMEPGSEIINFYRKDGSPAPASWDAIGAKATAAN